MFLRYGRSPSTTIRQCCFAKTPEFIGGTHFLPYDPTSMGGALGRRIDVDETLREITVMDVSCTPIREYESGRQVAQFLLSSLGHESGYVLLFDVTSRDSFDNLTQFGYEHLVRRRPRKPPGGVKSYPAGMQRFGSVLVGNKMDLVAGAPKSREVDSETAQEWADLQGIEYFELTSHDRDAIEEVMRALVRSILRAEKRDEEDLQEEFREQETTIWNNKDETVDKSSATKTKKPSSGLRKSFRDAMKRLRT